MLHGVRQFRGSARVHRPHCDRGAAVTSDERNLLLLLAKMVLSGTRRGPDEKELRAAIDQIAETETRNRDAFVAKIMKGSDCA
jgi:hypothetical protein